MNTELINCILKVQGFEPVNVDDPREMALIKDAFDVGRLDMLNQFAGRE